MNIKSRRWILLFWSLGLIVFVALLDFVTYVLIAENDSYDLWTMILIVTMVEAGLFISIYIAPFIFKKSKYPYVTCDVDEFEFRTLNWLSQFKWFWLLIFPLIISIVPIFLIYLVIYFSAWNTDMDTGKRIFNLGYLLVTIIGSLVFSVNNLLYLYVMRRVKVTKIINKNNDFNLKID